MQHVKAKPPVLDIPSALNKVIERRIKELGLTKKDVADALWIGRVNLWARFSGKVYWTFPELVSLGEILRMPISEFVRQAEREVMGSKQPVEVTLRFESIAEANRFLKGAQVSDRYKGELTPLQFLTASLDDFVTDNTKVPYKEHSALFCSMKRCL